MILLSVNEIRKYYGQEPVLEGVSFEIRPAERVSLVGPNGAGKTTLFRILAGRESPDGGTLDLHAQVRLGYLEQQPEFTLARTVWDEARSALDHFIQLAAESDRIAAELAKTEDAAERKRLGTRFDLLQHELTIHDAFHLDHKIEKILTGLGFPQSAYSQNVQTLSGGQQNRLLLAKLLLAEPELMLLDEPSNHLDIDATEWLEDYLVGCPSSILVVSHDRFFLDRVTTRTLELYHGTVDSYPGNFSHYWRQKAERLDIQTKTWEKQQEEIAKLEDFIRKNHYGQKHLQAEDRRKKLERIERVPRPKAIAAPPMAFPEATRTGDIVLRVEGLAKGFDRTVNAADSERRGVSPTCPPTRLELFKNLSLDILRGEKWGILGPNGSGKTTLLRCLVGEHQPDAGRVQIGSQVRLGYFDQQLASVDPSLPAMEAVRPPHKEFVELERRAMLARFGVIGDMAYQAVGSLSGGERNRTALARLAARDANFLVLDEPTNHLDLWARSSLERALKEFDGSVLMVSHDRYFLNQVCDHLLVVEPGRFRVILGNYDTYLHLTKQDRTRGGGIAASGGPVSSEKPKPAAPDDSKSGRRKRKFPYRKAADIELEIQSLEARIQELHHLMASPEVHRDGEKIKALMSELDEAQANLPTLYEHWEEAAELNG